MEKINLVYQIDDCVDWIKKNSCENVVLQFNLCHLKDSTTVVEILNNRCDNCSFYIVVSDSCGLDYLAPQHLGSNVVDGIIKFGRTCLAPPPSYVKEINTLFVFGTLLVEEELNFVLHHFKTLDPSIAKMVFFESQYLCLIQNVFEFVKDYNCTFVTLKSFSNNWTFCGNDHLIDKKINWHNRHLPKFDKIDHVIYIGDQVSLDIRINSMVKLSHIDVSNHIVYQIDTKKELRKRLAIIEKLKNKSQLNIGLLMTNCFPDPDDVIDKINSIKQKHHTFHKIALLQSTDECKLGNFSTLDAFLIMKECNCSSLLDSLIFHLPLITYIEYKIISGYPCEYGGYKWNEQSNHENEETDEDTDQNACQLVLIENLKPNKWFGLEVNAGLDCISVTTEGMKGLASSYCSEPQ